MMDPRKTRLLLSRLFSTLFDRLAIFTLFYVYLELPFLFVFFVFTNADEVLGVCKVLFLDKWGYSGVQIESS